jgi:hypothetical protein
LASVVGNSSSPGSLPVVSRMLGGLQFNGFAYNSKNPSQSAANEGCAYGACTTGQASCRPPKGGTTACTLLSPAGAPTEQALLNALRVYFAGTSAASVFAAPTQQNDNGATVAGAPMSYLQVWYPDIEYAAGWGKCPRQDLMTNPPTSCSTYTPPMSMPTVSIGGRAYNAQGLLQLAGEHIPTTPVALPLVGYNNDSGDVCSCKSPYVPRGAFAGDNVCVSGSHATDATNENNKYAATSNSQTENPPYYYGPCKVGYVWRQAHMGDYVCVTPAEAKDVATDNEAGHEPGAVGTRIKCSP